MAQQPRQFDSKFRRNITNTRVTRLWGRNEEQSAASFNVYISNNTVRLQVSTGLREDKQRYSPTFSFNFKDGQIPSFLAILGLLEKIRDNPSKFPAGEAVSFDCPIFGFIKTKSMSKAERRQIGTVKVGRSSKGIYWISAESGEYGRVKFPFILDRDIQLFRAGTNEEADEPFISECVMSAWVENTKLIIANTLTQEYVEPEDNNQGQGNRGGYNRNNQGNNSGYNNNRNDRDNYSNNQNNQQSSNQDSGNNQSSNNNQNSKPDSDWDDDFLP